MEETNKDEFKKVEKKKTRKLYKIKSSSNSTNIISSSTRNNCFSNCTISYNASNIK